MKTKLYKKFIRRACKLLRISREQLFAREFSGCVLMQYKFNCETKKLDRDISRLEVLQHKCPLSQMWRACDGHTAWLFKHWKHSKHKYEIKMRLALGQELSDVLSDIASRRKRT